MNKALQDLASLPRSEWLGYLRKHSGLPGPRANLRLMKDIMLMLDTDTAYEWASTEDEYAAMCGAAALAAQATTEDIQEKLIPSVLEHRWRVREGVVHGLQLLFEREPRIASKIVESWASDSQPLVIRAAIATICEPRLLKVSSNCSQALLLCSRATETLKNTPLDQRKTAEFRVLRQALGYCWSVAVSHCPAQGIPLFKSLDTSDADIAWIVRENLKKKRLQRVIPVSDSLAI